MEKQYYFLSGFFRSGNTVLSAILNQNPKIHSSPISGLIEHINQSDLISENFESCVLNEEDKKKSKFLISKMMEIYYSNINKPIIIDRNKVWLFPANIELIKQYVNPKPKIIFTTRPILEMVVSFISINKPSIIVEMNNSNFIKNTKISLNDNLANFLLSDFSKFGITRKLFLNSIDNPNNKDIIHIVKYENIIDNPKKTIDSIYDFLKIKKFNHDFNNITQNEKYDESLLNLSNNLHKVRKTISRSNLKIEDYLSIDCIEKYKNIRYF